MFYGYPISQWIEVGLYMLFVIVLFTIIFVVSCVLTNKFLHKKNKKFKAKKSEKKSYFIDVA